MLRCAVVTLLALAACAPGGREPTTPDAASDAKVTQPDAAPLQCYAQATEVDVALQIQIEQSCAIWNSLAELSGRATVTRTPTTLTIDFG
ncbi:MAG TPA: hypothetical protein VIV40_13065, partial [Kofleriaceae bacterium]